MKYLAWFGGVLVALFGVAYIVAFTSFGNSLVGPIIEQKIQEGTKLESRLTTFSLTMNEFEIFLELNKNNTILLKGNYSLFAQSFNIAYRVNLEELKTLKPLTKTQLQSSFATEGSVVGDMAFIKVDGTSDVAKSATSYHIELTDLNPTSIIAKVQNADLKSLLYLGGQKEYASAIINLDVNFKNITPKELDGNVLLSTKDGKLNTAVMQKDFNITIPATAFEMNLKAILAGDSANYTYALNSNLAKLTSSGNITPEPLALDVKYGVDIKELGVLKPITNADIRGVLRLSGDVKGNKKELVVTGVSDIASSDTSFRAVLKEFAPASVSANIKNMKLQDVLYMVKQPHYTDGLFSLNAEISDARADSLKGVVKSSIQKGLLNSKFLTKEFEFKSLMPATRYALETKTNIENNVALTELSLASNLANFDIKEARFNLDSAFLQSDYVVKAHDLNSLRFVTDRALKGAITVNGELKKENDLDFSAYSDIAGGKLVAKLHNDDFKANINSMQTLELLDMLLYPKIFKSSITGALTYNLAAQKGDFKGKLKDGKFTQNQVLDLAKRYAKTDLYQETFLGDVSAVINKENILASLALNSNRSHIKTKDTKLNSKTKQINSKIDINANGNPLEVTLTGSANAPKVGINAEELIKKEAKKAVEKEVKKFIEKEGGKELEEKAKKLFKGLF